MKYYAVVYMISGSLKKMEFYNEQIVDTMAL